MSYTAATHRHILWATLVMGGATLGAVVLGLVRNKAIAVIGGPAAIGLLGLFTTIVSLGASMATLGLDTSGVRQIAAASADPAEVARVRRAVWTLAIPLAFAAAILVWLFRASIATMTIGSPGMAAGVGLLSIGIAASAIAGTQTAILQGFGRIGAVARVRLWGSLLATIVGVAAVYLLPVAGIALAVIAIPFFTMLAAILAGRRLPSSEWSRLASDDLRDQWRLLASIGAVVTITNGIAALSQLATRAIVTGQMNLEAAGFYHAAWAITSVNLSLVLNAMAADYFPRLSKVADRPEAMADTLNHQLHVCLLLAGPAMILVSVFAPIVLALLFSSAFADSALLLRLFLAAGLLRLPIWALGYILLARRSGAAYFLGEVAGTSIIVLTWLLVPVGGLTGAGVAALLSGIVSFACYALQVRAHGMTLSRANARLLTALFLLLSMIALAFPIDWRLGAAIGTAGATVSIVAAWRGLRSAVRR